MLWQQSSFWTIRKPYKPGLRIPTILDRNLSVRQPVWLPNGLDFEWCMAYLCIFGLVFEQWLEIWMTVGWKLKLYLNNDSLTALGQQFLTI